MYSGCGDDEMVGPSNRPSGSTAGVAAAQGVLPRRDQPSSAHHHEASSPLRRSPGVQDRAARLKRQRGSMQLVVRRESVVSLVTPPSRSAVVTRRKTAQPLRTTKHDDLRHQQDLLVYSHNRAALPPDARSPPSARRLSSSASAGLSHRQPGRAQPGTTTHQQKQQKYHRPITPSSVAKARRRTCIIGVRTEAPIEDDNKAGRERSDQVSPPAGRRLLGNRQTTNLSTVSSDRDLARSAGDRAGSSSPAKAQVHHRHHHSPPARRVLRETVNSGGGPGAGGGGSAVAGQRRRVHDLVKKGITHDKPLSHIEEHEGTLFVVSQDQIHLYDIEAKQHLYSIDAVARRIALFDGILYYANRTTPSSLEPDIIVAWNTKLRKVTHIFKGHQKWITSLFIVDKVLYSSATDHTCRCWNVVRWNKQGFTTAMPHLAQKSAQDLALDTEERVEAALQLWEQLFNKGKAGVESAGTASPSRAGASNGISFPEELCVYTEDDAITSAAIYKEMNLLFTASPDRKIRAYSLLTNECVGIYAGHTGWIYGVIVQDGVLYSSSRDQTIRAWNIETFECAVVFDVDTDNLNSKKFFVTGGVLFVICDDFTVKLFNAKTGKLLRVLEGHRRPIRSMLLSGQRELFTASGDGTIRRWNIKKGTTIATYQGHTNGVTSLILDSNRKLLYSAAQDGKVRIWSLEDPSKDVHNAPEPANVPVAPPVVIKVHDHVLQRVAEEEEKRKAAALNAQSTKASAEPKAQRSAVAFVFKKGAAAMGERLKTRLGGQGTKIVTAGLSRDRDQHNHAVKVDPTEDRPSVVVSEPRAMPTRRKRTGTFGDTYRPHIGDTQGSGGGNATRESDKARSEDKTTGAAMLRSNSSQQMRMQEEARIKSGSRMKEHMYRVYSTKNIQVMAKLSTGAPSALHSTPSPSHSVGEGQGAMVSPRTPRTPRSPSPESPRSPDRVQVIDEGLARWRAEQEMRTHNASLLDMFDEDEDQVEHESEHEGGQQADEEVKTGKNDSESESEGGEEERSSAPRRPIEEDDEPEDLTERPTDHAGVEELLDSTAEQSFAAAAAADERQAMEDLQAELIDEVRVLTALSVRGFMDIPYVIFGGMVHQALRLIVKFSNLAAGEANSQADDHGIAGDRQQAAALLLELMQSGKQMLSVGMLLLHAFKQRRAWHEEGLHVDAAVEDQDEELRRTFLFILRGVITALKRYMSWRQGGFGVPVAPSASTVREPSGVHQAEQPASVGLTPVAAPVQHDIEIELDGVSELEQVIREIVEDRQANSAKNVAAVDTPPPTSEERSDKDLEAQAMEEQGAGGEDEDELDQEWNVVEWMSEVADAEVPQLADEVKRPLGEAPPADTVLRHAHDLRELVYVLRESSQTGTVPSWNELAGLVMVLIHSSRGVAKGVLFSSATRRRLLALECAVVRLTGEAVRQARGLVRLMQIAAAAAQQQHADLVTAYAAAIDETRQGLRLRLGDLLSAVAQLLAAIRHAGTSAGLPLPQTQQML